MVLEGMDSSGKGKIGMEGGNHEHLSYRQMESFFPSLWDQQPSSQNLGFPESNDAHNVLVGRPQLDPMSKGGALFLQSSSGILPTSLSQFPADSAFIERAARFSCFGGSVFAPIASSFGLNPLMDAYLNIEREASGTTPQKNDLNMGEGSGDAMDLGNSHGYGDESGDVEICGQRENPNLKGPAVRKRKRSTQLMEIDQIKGESSNPVDADKENTESIQNVGQNNSTPEQNDTITTKQNGKQMKDGVEVSKKDYIHVRARRGQATNSHSLAERVRREKISERMKFLQDLVPGCNKVTGKAVMLDEIINYVQSLQRQVEFLSMKLATVNPQLELNIEGLLSKDMFQSHAGPSSGIAFSPDMAFPLLQQNQQVLVQSIMSGMVPPFDAHRRAITTQMAGVHTYRESKLQMSNPWDDELHNAIQMGLIGNPPLNIQDMNGKNHSGSPT